jgi:hypothetical protein
MTAPVVEALRRHKPDLRLTIQTAVPRAFLETRYGNDFTYVADIPDFGLKMLSSTKVDLDASACGYKALHADWSGVVGREAGRLAQASPDLVLANAPYVTIAAAAQAQIPVLGLSSVEWADIYRHYLGHRPEAAEISSQMVAAYNSADAFLRVTPAMDMPSLTNVREIGTVGSCGTARRAEIRRALGVEEGTRIGLIAFGGIDHGLDLSSWPVLPGWIWLSSLAVPEGYSHLKPWQSAGFSFSDVLASSDVLVTKPGYGSFVEACLTGLPVLYQPRPDWPESPALDRWLCSHTKALAVEMESLLGQGLEEQLRKLFSLQIQLPTLVDGNEQAALILKQALESGSFACKRS